ncbi:hypothetical protein [Nodularia chucula]|uniref:hypothetical protein n=1 Tax=Nodularia chucula TaxID=3093667 RepID=UPI0039C63FD2
MNYRQKYLKLTTISLISTLVSTLLTISIPSNSVKADITNEKLQQSLGGRGPAFVELLISRLSPHTKAQLLTSPTIAEIKQIAKAQNATLIQYSITQCPI